MEFSEFVQQYSLSGAFLALVGFFCALGIVFMVMKYLALLAHELGHMVAASLLFPKSVTSVVIGTGKTVFSFTSRGTSYTFRHRPDSGHVAYNVTMLARERDDGDRRVSDEVESLRVNMTRAMAVTISGIAVNMALFLASAAAILGAIYLTSWEQNLVPLAALVMFSFSNLVLGVDNAFSADGASIASTYRLRKQLPGVRSHDDVDKVLGRWHELCATKRERVSVSENKRVDVVSVWSV